MGDRGNIIVNQDGGGLVYLYTHWTGYRLHDDLRSALIRGEDRWDDVPYLTRIIFSEMTKGQEMETTGFGISTQMGDGGTDIVVDPQNKRVTWRDGTASFREYIG